MKYRVWFAVDKRQGKTVARRDWQDKDYYQFFGMHSEREIKKWDLKPCDISGDPDIVWVYVEGEFDEH